MDFIFYDLETSGLSPEFDQPLQFAAIRTDAQLVERERIELRCRLAPHVLPAPQALVVTRIAPHRLDDPALPALPEFAAQVLALTERWAPAIWTGYNSLQFDEAVLRQMFYQNLLPNIDATQRNGNRRLDMLTAVQAAHVRDPGLFIWPRDETGRPSFRLDRLARANGFTAHQAHDALGDVEATLWLARRIARQSPELWTDLLATTRKDHVEALLESFRPLTLVLRPRGGAPRAHVGCLCGQSAVNPAERAFFDLEAADPAELLDAPGDTLLDALRASPALLHRLDTTQAPALFKIPQPEDGHLHRAALIAAAPAFRDRVGQMLAARAPRPADRSDRALEAQIDDDLIPPADLPLLEAFRRADWPQRQQIVAALSDPRLRQLGHRLIAMWRPDLPEPAETARVLRDLLRKWHAEEGTGPGWMTLARARREIAELRSQVPAAVLDPIARFIEERAEGLSQNIAAAERRPEPPQSRSLPKT